MESNEARSVYIDAIGGNDNIQHYVWLPKREKLEDAMVWCVRTVPDISTWQLILRADDGGFERVGIGFSEKDTAMVFMIKYGGDYEEKEA